ncbi:MAG TPA: glycosyltransferase [Candidatus Acidoferrales bacterium]|nr:glycosyltransferase [Candidatus Acidoferrales bacterium]
MYAGAKPRSARFCYSRDVVALFYILILVQIAVGIYSLWTGFEWYQMVRRRAASHSGFYAPVAAVICPCKGLEPGLEENLAALAQFDYPSYEIYFALATSLDPAVKIVEKIKAASQRPIHIVIAGPPENSSDKVHNLSRAVGALPTGKFEALVFIDSDVRLPRGWLRKLVAPLQNPRVGATTAYRWIIPSRKIGEGGFASAMASAWNASVATLLGREKENFCWGGGTALRWKTFEDAGVLAAWNGALSDDFTLTQALNDAGSAIVFCPECMAATPHPWTGTQLLDFTTRQIVITRVYSPTRWLLGMISHLSYSLTFLYGAVVILATMLSGDPWVQLALLEVAPLLLAGMKGALRTAAVEQLLPEWKSKLSQWAWVWIVLAPLVPFLFSWNFLSSLATKRIRWRGIRYELVSPSTTRILTR